MRLKGLGRLQRSLNKDFIYSFRRLHLYYLPAIEGSYDYLLIGKPNEPETHLFLDRVFNRFEEFSFIDVGASVGEFAFGISHHQNLKTIYAFEPRPECAEVLRKNKELNSEKRIEILEYAVTDGSTNALTIYLNPGGSSSGIFSSGTDHKHINVKATALDTILTGEMVNPIILIDVEGGEPLVIKGGIGFINRNKPLIIFEYNNTSKQHYNLKDIFKLLGNGYEIFRLNNKGLLDKDLSDTWNCVAVPSNTIFSKIIGIC